MNVLEKILEEIEEKIKFAEKIIVKPPCDKLDEIANDTAEAFIEAYKECVKIIRSHMDEIPRCEKCSRRKWYQDGYNDGKDINIPTNDGWIPVSEELPPFGEKLQATILHHEWIADYDSSWVPEEERTYHQEYTEVCEIYPMGGMWFFVCKEDEYQRGIAYIKPKKDLGNPISEIIAWQPLPEPYKEERDNAKDI